MPVSNYHNNNSEEMSSSGGTQLPIVDSLFLYQALRNDSTKGEILILDCRGVAEYSMAHVRGAINVALPSLMLRRLASGKLSLQQVLRHLAPDEGDVIARLYRCVPVVLYDHLGAHSSLPLLITALCRKLIQEGCSAHCLAGE